MERSAYVTPEAAERRERETRTDFLARRRDLNKRYQSADFDSWLFSRLDVASGEAVLDVGCGTGAQAIEFGRRAGPSGLVCAFDISADSVATLKANPACGKNVEAFVADMVDLGKEVAARWPGRKFNLVHSSYALYYADDVPSVLSQMVDLLLPDGRLAVFTPNQPHGMVDFVRRFAPIPAEVDDSLTFGPRALEPFVRARFKDVAIHHFHNEMQVTELSDAMNFYRATTYFHAPSVAEVEAAISREISQHGAFRYVKNGYLIVGKGAR